MLHFPSVYFEIDIYKIVFNTTCHNTLQFFMDFWKTCFLTLKRLTILTVKTWVICKILHTVYGTVLYFGFSFSVFLFLVRFDFVVFYFIFRLFGFMDHWDVWCANRIGQYWLSIDNPTSLSLLFLSLFTLALVGRPNIWWVCDRTLAGIRRLGTAGAETAQRRLALARIIALPCLNLAFRSLLPLPQVHLAWVGQVYR